MTGRRTENGNVRLSSQTWVGLLGVFLTQIIAVAGVYADLKSRVTAVEVGQKHVISRIEDLREEVHARHP